MPPGAGGEADLKRLRLWFWHYEDGADPETGQEAKAEIEFARRAVQGGALTLRLGSVPVQVRAPSFLILFEGRG